MAGLLDFLDTDQGRLGLGLLAAAGPRADGAGFGQRLMEGVGSMDQYRQQNEQKKFREMQYQQAQMQMEDAKRKQAQEQADRERQATIRQGMGHFFTPGQQALAPLMGDASTGILPSQGRAAVGPSFDAGGAAQFLAQNGAYDKALPLLESLNRRPEFSPEVRYDQSGRAFMTAKDGSVKFLDGISARDKLEEVRLGDKVGFRSPYSTEMQGSMPIGQSADSKASNAVTMRGQDMTDSRAREQFDFNVSGGGEGGASQAGLNKLFGKPQAGYRWKPDGSLEFIPGGPADQKAQAQKGGEGTVGGIVADLRDKYSQLDQNNGIVSTNNRVGTNIGARIASTGFGQGVAGTFGTQSQSLRDSVAMTRPLLLQSIMKATGMSAKQMDSNVELKLYLAIATDPTKGLEANMEALDRIESLYGGGNEKYKAQQPVKKVVNGWGMEKVN